mmetsp:Transcript_7181/g.17041  ORF Transcript_7181/g.17041 Transcript_7181/m.17041 type:complete len:236 (-) Transcript_7181:602-1309(-)
MVLVVPSLVHGVVSSPAAFRIETSIAPLAIGSASGASRNRARMIVRELPLRGILQRRVASGIRDLLPQSGVPRRITKLLHLALVRVLRRNRLENSKLRLLRRLRCLRLLQRSQRCFNTARGPGGRRHAFPLEIPVEIREPADFKRTANHTDGVHRGVIGALAAREARAHGLHGAGAGLAPGFAPVVVAQKVVDVGCGRVVVQVDTCGSDNLEASRAFGHRAPPIVHPVRHVAGHN